MAAEAEVPSNKFTKSNFVNFSDLVGCYYLDHSVALQPMQAGNRMVLAILTEEALPIVWKSKRGEAMPGQTGPQGHTVFDPQEYDSVEIDGKYQITLAQEVASRVEAPAYELKTNHPPQIETFAPSEIPADLSASPSK